MSETYSFTTLTPCACHGPNGSQGPAEMRIPSIRGHLRNWHRILYGEQDCTLCWGGPDASNPPKIHASYALLRLTATGDKTNTIQILPQHNDRSGKTRALDREQEYALSLSWRSLMAIENAEEKKEHVRNVIQCWLLLGTLGLRSSRAFGSIWPLEKAPATRTDYENALNILLQKKYFFKISLNTVPLPELKYCTDTIEGRPGILGGINPRCTSPVQMKYVKLSGGYHLVLHASSMGKINDCIALLKNKPVGKNFTWE